MRRGIATTGWVWGSALALASLLFVACGGESSGGHPAATPTSTPPIVVVEDAKLSAADRCRRRRQAQRRRLPEYQRDDACRRPFRRQHARSSRRGVGGRPLGQGGRYPVGTIIQLVPQEAMVKRAPSFSPTTNDWEFFSLDVSAQGTRILSRGGAKVLNRFGGSCASCHSAAAPQFDLVCGTNHGCAPLPFGADVIAALQKSDPRPRP